MGAIQNKKNLNKTGKKEVNCQGRRWRAEEMWRMVCNEAFINRTCSRLAGEKARVIPRFLSKNVVTPFNDCRANAEELI